MQITAHRGMQQLEQSRNVLSAGHRFAHKQICGRAIKPSEDKQNKKQPLSSTQMSAELIRHPLRICMSAEAANCWWSSDLQHLCEENALGVISCRQHGLEKIFLCLEECNDHPADTVWCTTSEWSHSSRKYTSDFVLLYTSTPLQVRRKYCTFHSSTYI